MKRFDIQDIDICIDCAMLLANGGGDAVDSSWCPDDEDHDPKCYGTCEQAAENHATAVERNWPGTVWMLHVGSHECEYCGSEARERGDANEDCEAWFSWSRCGGCGSGLGGSRMHGIAMIEITEGNK